MAEAAGAAGAVDGDGEEKGAEEEEVAEEEKGAEEVAAPSPPTATVGTPIFAAPPAPDDGSVTLLREEEVDAEIELERNQHVLEGRLPKNIFKMNRRSLRRARDPGGMKHRDRLGIIDRMIEESDRIMRERPDFEDPNIQMGVYNLGGEFKTFADNFPPLWQMLCTRRGRDPILVDFARQFELRAVALEDELELELETLDSSLENDRSVAQRQFASDPTRLEAALHELEEQYERDMQATELDIRRKHRQLGQSLLEEFHMDGALQLSAWFASLPGANDDDDL